MRAIQALLLALLLSSGLAATASAYVPGADDPTLRYMYRVYSCDTDVDPGGPSSPPAWRPQQSVGTPTLRYGEGCPANSGDATSGVYANTKSCEESPGRVMGSSPPASFFQLRRRQSTASRGYWEFCRSSNLTRDSRVTSRISFPGFTHLRGTNLRAAFNAYGYHPEADDQGGQLSGPAAGPD